MYFRGKYHYLSNMAGYGFYVSGRYYPTSEHFFQSCKCKHKKDFERIMNSESPAEAKKSQEISNLEIIGTILKLR